MTADIKSFADWREVKAHLEEVYDRARGQAEQQEFDSDRDTHRKAMRVSGEWLLDNDQTWLEYYMSVLRERMWEHE